MPQPSTRARVQPALTEPIAREFIEFIGGPVGTHAGVGRARWWTPVRVLIATAYVFLSFGFLAKAPCLRASMKDGQAVGLDWHGNWQYTTACYNDIVPLYNARGLDKPGFVYAYSWVEQGHTRYMEYPVLAGLFQGLMGWISRGTYPLVKGLSLHIAPQAWYFAITAFVMSMIWVGVIRMVAELAGNRVWDTVLVAASPLIIVHAFTNWDIPSIAFAVGAMLAVKHERPLVAGVLIGLGTAFKMWPLFLLGAYLVLAIRSSKLKKFGVMAGGAAGAWLLVNLPIMIAYPYAWAEFAKLNSNRSWEWTTIWAIMAREFGRHGFDGSGQKPAILNAVTFVLFAAACIAICAFGVTTKRRPRVAELTYLIVASFLLINKVWSPQYSLWLVVPAVLALPNWRLLLSWMTVDAFVWPMLMWHMMGAKNKGIPGGLLDLVILTRDGFIIAIGVLVIRQMLGRTEDKVLRDNGGVDPLSGGFGVVDTFRPRKHRTVATAASSVAQEETA